MIFPSVSESGGQSWSFLAAWIWHGIPTKASFSSSNSYIASEYGSILGAIVYLEPAAANISSGVRATYGFGTQLPAFPVTSAPSIKPVSKAWISSVETTPPFWATFKTAESVLFAAIAFW